MPVNKYLYKLDAANYVEVTMKIIKSTTGSNFIMSFLLNWYLLVPSQINNVKVTVSKALSQRYYAMKK